MSPSYTSEIFSQLNHGHNTRNSSCKLQLPYRSSNYGQKALSYLGPKLWNSLPSHIKLSANINTFKHNIKKVFFEKLQKKEDNIYVYYWKFCFSSQHGYRYCFHWVVVDCYSCRSALCLFPVIGYMCISVTRDHNENKVFAICIMLSLPPFL